MGCDNRGTVSAAPDVLCLGFHIAITPARQELWAAIPAGSLSAQNHG